MRELIVSHVHAEAFGALHIVQRGLDIIFFSLDGLSGAPYIVQHVKNRQIYTVDTRVQQSNMAINGSTKQQPSSANTLVIKKIGGVQKKPL